MLTYSTNTHLLKTHSVLGTAPALGHMGVNDIDIAPCSWNDGLVGETDMHQGINLLGLKGHWVSVLQGKSFKSYEGTLGK